MIGDVRYGVLALVWIFLGYFGMFDPGLARAAAYHIAKLQNAPAKDREDVFWTALVINLGFGLVGGFVFYVLAEPFFISMFNMPPGLRPEVLASVPWLAASVPISIVSGVLSGVVLARERFAFSSALNIFNIFLTQIAPLVVAYLHGPSLTWLIPAVLIARAAGSIPTFLVIARVLPLGSGGRFNQSLVKSLFSYGGWITITNLVGPILNSADRMLIGAMLSAEAVTLYTVPSNVVVKAKVIPGALSGSLFPKFAYKSEEESRNLAEDAVITLAAIMTPIIIAGIIALPTLMRLWVGAKLAYHSAPIGTIIFLSVWIDSLTFIPYDMLQATNRADLTAKAHLAEVLPFLGVLWLGIHFFGLAGAAWTTVFQTALDGALLFYLAKQIRVWGKIWFGALLTFLSQLVAPTNLVSFQTILALVLLVIAMIWSWYSSPRVRQIVERQYGYLKPFLSF
jgi:O-antigen/teichoic acid export membrane protein